MIALEQQLPVLYGADCKTRVQPLLAQGYQSVVDDVWTRLPGDRAAPELHVVHSPVAHPVSFHSDGERHLIYDQYLGQVFNKLTRLELADANSDVTYSYAFKLFGQRNLIRGQFDIAAAMADSSESIASQAQIRAAIAESSDEFELRSAVAMMQERFTLCHELVHFVIEDGNADELRRRFDPILGSHVDRMARAVAAMSDGEFRRHMVESLAADDARLAERRGRAVDDDASFQLTEEQLDDNIRQYAAQLDHMKRPELAQEAMCDYFGAILAADHLRSSDEMRPIVYAASALGLLHLRLLQYFDSVADPDKSSRENFELAILRASILRTGLSLELSTRPGGKELAEEFHALTTTFNQGHSKVVLDQVLTFDLARFATDMEARVTSPADPETTRQKLGFGPVPRFTLEQAEALLHHRNALSQASINHIAGSNHDE